MQLNTELPARFAVLGLFAIVLGSMVLCALLLIAIDEAHLGSTTDDCLASDGGTSALGVIMIGLIARLVGEVPVFVSESLLRRRVVYRTQWDAKAIQHYLQTRQAKDIAVMGAMLSHCSFCMFILLCFLANLAEEHEWKWNWSAATVLFLTFVLLPFIRAVVLASTAACSQNQALGVDGLLGQASFTEQGVGRLTEANVGFEEAEVAAARDEGNHSSTGYIGSAADPDAPYNLSARRAKAMTAAQALCGADGNSGDVAFR